MATYKKRGYKAPKPKIKEEQVEEEVFDGESTTKEVFDTLDETASRTEEFVIKNQKNIFILIGIVAALVLGYLGYQEFIVKPKQAEGMNDMFQAQQYFDEAINATKSKDSLFTLALNGGEGKYGMLDIAKEFSGTKAGNLANYYAGMAYLNMKDYKNAVSYLNNFESDDEILAPMAKGAIGDAFVQLNQNQDALDYYKQAAQLRNNEYTTPMYLFKAGLVALDLDKANEALGFFETIKEEYPNATEATSIDTFIGKAKVLATN